MKHSPLELHCRLQEKLHRVTGPLALFSFSGPENKIDLILCRPATFKEADSLNNMTICPLHRGKLG